MTTRQISAAIPQHTTPTLQHTIATGHIQLLIILNAGKHSQHLFNLFASSRHDVLQFVARCRISLNGQVKKRPWLRNTVSESIKSKDLDVRHVCDGFIFFNDKQLIHGTIDDGTSVEASPREVHFHSL